MPRHDAPSGAGGPPRSARPPSFDRSPQPEDNLRAAVRSARDLKTAKGRREQGRFLIEGIRLLEDALTQQVPIARIFVTPHLLASTPRGQHLARWLPTSTIPIFEVGERMLALVADTETPAGIVAEAVLPDQPPTLPAPHRSGLQVLILDQVRDPGNTGAILRTAAASGVRHVVTSQGSVDLWAPKVVRAAAGAHFRIVLHGPQSQVTLAEWLAGWPQIVLADGSATTSLYAVDWQTPSALILGNEAHGPSDWPATARLVRVRIPMCADTESLNVAAAAAVFLYEGQRHFLRTV